MTKQPMPAPVKAHGSTATTSRKSEWEVDVYVYLDSVADPNDPQFRIETCLPVDPANQRTIIFHNRHRPGFNIKFHLEDLTGGDHRFPQDECEAIWSEAGPICPTAQPTQQILQPRRVEQHGQRLVVHNPNCRIEQFMYTLRVTNGGAPIRLDPGGDNQNGPMQ